MFTKFIQVQDHHRVLVVKNDRFHCILKPGSHLMFVRPFVTMETEVHPTRRLVFNSRWADHICRNCPEVVKAHFQIVETDDSQVGMIYVNNSLHQVLLPGKRLLFWKDVADIHMELINVVESPVISDSMLTTFENKQNKVVFTNAADDSSSSLLLEELFEQSTSRIKGRN